MPRSFFAEERLLRAASILLDRPEIQTRMPAAN